MTRIWPDEPDDRAFLLEITDAGIYANGDEMDGNEAVGRSPDCALAMTAKATLSTPLSRETDKVGRGRESGNTEAHQEAAARPRVDKIRGGKKQSTLIALPPPEGGARISEIVAATGWQPHKARGASSGVLKGKPGLEVASEKDEARGLVYSLPSD